MAAARPLLRCASRNKAIPSIPVAPLRRSFSQCRPARNGAAQEQGRSQGQSSRGSSDGSSEGATGKLRGLLNSTAAEAALGASAGVILLGLAGMGYHKWYKADVLAKMEDAFAPGYDPVLALAQSSDGTGANRGQLAYVRVPDRQEDELIARILRGEERGRYFLILGPKGTGKTTSIIQAMKDQDADGVAFFEAHADPDIVVDRFSEAINYTMNRDFLGNLVGLSDLSGMSRFQHLERSLHKLERALISRRQKTGRPAVIVMNAAHLLAQGDQPQDETALEILTVFQQRAEKWASAGTCTFVITSNDYRIYDFLRRHSNRMDTLSFRDLSRQQSLAVLRDCRRQYWGEEDARGHDVGVLDEVYRLTGGRLSILNKVARRHDMLKAAKQLVEDDAQFVLSKTGIIEDHDDDVMDEQKWSTCSWLLFLELAKRQRAMEEEQQRLLETAAGRRLAQQHDAEERRKHEEANASASKDGALSSVTESPLTDPSRDAPHVHEDGSLDVSLDVPDPSIPWGEARQVMTRPDYVLPLDHLNLIQIDRHHSIRAQSMPLLRAFAKVALDDPEFEDRLERVMDRVSAIESLLRTKELVWKDEEKRFPVQLMR